MDRRLYSIRMRASNGNTHISGAERIVGEEDVAGTVAGLVSRAQNHGRGMPTNIKIAVDSLEGRKIKLLPPLPVFSFEARQVSGGYELALGELARAGVSGTAAVAGFNAIADGSAKGGAVLMDARTGARIDCGENKVVRARTVDYDGAVLPVLASKLVEHNIEKSRLKDALALATKVANAPGAVAELCISDDPDYVTGYVASLATGYNRITPLKEKGSFSGGRVFFVDIAASALADYITYLREIPVLVSGELEFNIQ